METHEIAAALRLAGIGVVVTSRWERASRRIEHAPSLDSIEFERVDADGAKAAIESGEVGALVVPSGRVWLIGLRSAAATGRFRVAVQIGPRATPRGDFADVLFAAATVLSDAFDARLGDDAGLGVGVPPAAQETAVAKSDDGETEGDDDE